MCPVVSLHGGDDKQIYFDGDDQKLLPRRIVAALVRNGEAANAQARRDLRDGGKDPLGVAHKHEDEDGGDKPQVGHRQQLPLGDDSQRDVDVRLSAPPIIMT